jgi:hypothetical protein
MNLYNMGESMQVRIEAITIPAFVAGLIILKLSPIWDVAMVNPSLEVSKIPEEAERFHPNSFTMMNDGTTCMK